MRSPLASMHRWIVEPLPQDVERSLQGLRRLADVRRVAVMPDVHLAHMVLRRRLAGHRASALSGSGRRRHRLRHGGRRGAGRRGSVG